jgi:type IV pilus assembly protein PilC
MAILLSSGVPILDGLAITAKTAGNRVVEKAIMDSRVSISQGKTVAEPLRESKIFPPMVCQMVAVGESTGGLDGMLRKVAELYEDEVDDAVATLTALMEPMIMVILGVILGGLVISMYLPIFQMGSLV